MYERNSVVHENFGKIICTYRFLRETVFLTIEQFTDTGRKLYYLEGKFLAACLFIRYQVEAKDSFRVGNNYTSVFLSLMNL